MKREKNKRTWFFFLDQRKWAEIVMNVYLVLTLSGLCSGCARPLSWYRPHPCGAGSSLPAAPGEAVRCPSLCLLAGSGSPEGSQPCPAVAFLRRLSPLEDPGPQNPGTLGVVC